MKKCVDVRLNLSSSDSMLDLTPPERDCGRDFTLC